MLERWIRFDAVGFSPRGMAVTLAEIMILADDGTGSFESSAKRTDI